MDILAAIKREDAKSSDTKEAIALTFGKGWFRSALLI